MVLKNLSIQATVSMNFGDSPRRLVNTGFETITLELAWVQILSYLFSDTLKIEQRAILQTSLPSIAAWNLVL